MKILWIALLVAILSGGLVLASGGRNLAQPKVVDATVCEISRNPNKYHGITVRVRGTVSTIEGNVLYDEQHPTCGNFSLAFDNNPENGEVRQFVRLLLQEVRPKKTPADMEHCGNVVCGHCPRYSMAATFTGRLNNALFKRKRLNAYELQRYVTLSVTSVDHTEATDLSSHYRKDCFEAVSDR